ncbi:SDR family oxidoreductase [Candidatus Solirubrobacter pratensis]|uniref:SDR family oxidoreductase n=1 Tax=Candidatus Solirubrobacter pratensis TaxID=1298857 RepID=UPI00041AB82C|nr:SDR family oxidoreductase [Candidatus Solirubrobacter pratensis]
MKVAIAGGHGKIALLLTQLLAGRGDEVRGLIRRAEHEQDVRAAGGEPVLCDIEREPVQAVATAAAGCDAVVFAAGAGPGSGAERKWTVDYAGAVKLMAVGVERYVMISSVGADPDAEGEDVFAAYLRAKGRADAELQASGLAYTIVRPGPLTDEPATGLVSLAERLDRREITRADTAAIVAGALADPRLAGATFVATGGKTPVGDALAALLA